MAIVTSIELWKDVGFLEDSAETPLRTSSLPTVDLTVTEGINPTKGRLFTQFKLKGEWADLYEMSYMRITYNFKAGNISLYAWVDDVSVISDTDTSPVTLISFHIDLWRSYINSVVLGRGTVTRRPDTGNLRPPQGYTILQMNQNYFEPLVDTVQDMYWVYYTYTDENTGGAVTTTTVACFPLSAKSLSISLAIPVGESGGDEHVLFPTAAEIFSGKWDEVLKLTPSRIKGAFISPVPPVAMRYTTYSNHPEISGTAYEPTDRVGGWEKRRVTITHPQDHHVISDRAVFVNEGDLTSTGTVNGMFQEFAGSLGSNYGTSDLMNAVITGFDGETIGMIPFSRSVRSYKYRMIVSTVSAYIQIRFDGIKSHQEGICFTVPCPVLEVTENSYSEYNYTGAREYDKASREEEVRYSKETQAVDAGTSLGLGIATAGAGKLGNSRVLGSLLGGNSAANTAASQGAASASSFIGLGSIIEGASSLVSLGVHNFLNLETNHNANLDSISNDYYARQSDGLILPGTGFDFIRHGRAIGIAQMTADAYSQDVAQNIKNQYGVEVFEPRTSCDTLLVQGPLQIMNLNITGDAPVAAKEYIKARLQRGVLLV